MNEFVKVIHVLALLAGSASGIGYGLMLSRLISAPNGPPPPIVADVMRYLGLMAQTSIIVVWLTGIAMAYMKYGTMALGWIFYIHLTAAGIVLLTIANSAVLAARAQKAGIEPDYRAMKRMTNIATICVIIAVICAVALFS